MCVVLHTVLLMQADMGRCIFPQCSRALSENPKRREKSKRKQNPEINTHTNKRTHSLGLALIFHFSPRFDLRTDGVGLYARMACELAQKDAAVTKMVCRSLKSITGRRIPLNNLGVTQCPPEHGQWLTPCCRTRSVAPLTNGSPAVTVLPEEVIPHIHK